MCEIAYVVPLYLYDGLGGWTPNISHDVYEVLTAQMTGKPTPVEILIIGRTAMQIKVSKELLKSVQSYIDKNYFDETTAGETVLRCLKKDTTFEDVSVPLLVAEDEPYIYEEVTDFLQQESLDDLVSNLDESFSATLLRLIDKKGQKDSEIYNRAGIDRRLFSKIRSNIDYSPSKATVLAFAIALELTLSQTEDLLERAGFSLSHSRKFDVIVEYFILSQIYDILTINEVLYSYDQPLLGG